MKQERVRINAEIKAPSIRVINEEGQQLGIMSVHEALKIANEQGLDLIEIVPNANPPVCKIMDYGKYRYEQSKREKIQKKHQHVTHVKEIRFHPNTDTHDFEFKTRHAREFILNGDKVKATVIFKGREITYQDQGKELLDRFAEKLSDIARIEQEATMEGRQMVAIFVPDKKKKPSEPKQSKEG
ncbi:MAG: translation initiation factor IF-3 [Bacteroidetes bacterium]|nr:translation initiation factor IF-3 [Bacteroidota bacterium]